MQTHIPNNWKGVNYLPNRPLRPRLFSAQPNIKIRPWFPLISLLHFFITTHTDSIVFDSVDYVSFSIYFIVKMIVIVLLVLFWQMAPVIYNAIY